MKRPAFSDLLNTSMGISTILVNTVLLTKLFSSSKSLKSPLQNLNFVFFFLIFVSSEDMLHFRPKTSIPDFQITTFKYIISIFLNLRMDIRFLIPFNVLVHHVCNVVWLENRTSKIKGRELRCYSFRVENFMIF